MILVDSSAFIEYYRPSGLRRAQDAVAAAIAADQVAINGIIQVEIVAFATSPEDYRRLLSDFTAYHRIELTEADFDRAVELGFDLRRKGFTLPATDLIIAASALRTRSTLYHLDSHFDVLSKHAGLSAVNLGGG